MGRYVHEFPPIYLRCVVAKVFRKRGERKKEKKTAKENATQTKIPRFRYDGDV